MASEGGGGATLPRGEAANLPAAGGPRPAHLPRAGGAGGKPPVPLPDGASARAGSGGRSAGLPAPMAGERTRRFTRSLLRPGQAAELRHSAATAAAAAAGGRLQQRVSAAGRRRAERPGRPRRAAGSGPGAKRAREPRRGAAGSPGGQRRGGRRAGTPAGTSPPGPPRLALAVPPTAAGGALALLGRELLPSSPELRRLS